MRNLAIDHLRGWGILFIVLGHILGAGCHLSTGTTQTFCTLGYKYFYAFHVPLFFVVAGMTFTQHTWKDFFIRRFNRLLIPYFVFGIASIVFYWGMTSFSTPLLLGSDTTGYYSGKAIALPLWKMLVNLLVGGWWPLGFVANSVLWFIPVLFAVECAAQGVSRFIHSKWVWGALAVGLWCFDIFFSLPQLPWGLSRILQYLPYFIVGICVGKEMLPNLIRGWGTVAATLMILLFGALAIWNPWQWYEKSLWQHAYSTILTFGNIFAWWMLSQCLSVKCVAQCGIWSLGIMLMHKFPVLFFQNTFLPIRNLFKAGLGEALLGSVIVFAASMLCCAFACIVILKTAPRLLGTSHR